MNFCDELAWTFGVASITEQRAQTYVRGTDCDAWFANFFMGRHELFFLTLVPDVTLVHHHTLLCVHFFLDFVFQ
jgi:hypothetical protein